MAGFKNILKNDAVSCPYMKPDIPVNGSEDSWKWRGLYFSSSSLAKVFVSTGFFFFISTLSTGDNTHEM